MRRLFIASLLAGSAVLGACATVPPATVAAAGGVCGSYGYIDINNDGYISGDE
jgi:hypothetical protein